MKKIRLGLLASTSLMALGAMASLTACGDDGALDLNKSSYKVGVLQYISHDALDAATESFKTELKVQLEALGKTVEFEVKNPEADETTLTSMASQLVKSCDLVMGNATPAATALKSAAKKQGKTKRPILFTSVTDPVEVELVESNTTPGGYVTGTSDMNPVAAQIELAFEADPTIDKVGFLYTATETNSVVQCDAAKAYLKNSKNFTDSQIKTRAFNEPKDISASVTALVNEGVDFIYRPTDNTVASAITTVTRVTNPAGVFLIAGESNMVTNGATFTFSVDYANLGKITGEMAGNIFKGETIATMPVQTQTENFVFAYNAEAISELNLQLSNEFKTKYNIA